MKIIQGQCKRHSRKVKNKDIERVKETASEMVDLCKIKLGKYPNAFAIAHCQIDHDDPLRFFVSIDGRLIINPKIKPVGDETEVDLEGCYSYAFRDRVKVRRFKKIFVDYNEMENNGTIKRKTKELDGLQARVFQHEIDHFNGKAIY